jgi:hypothetical protein
MSFGASAFGTLPFGAAGGAAAPAEPSTHLVIASRITSLSAPRLRLASRIYRNEAPLRAVLSSQILPADDGAFRRWRARVLIGGTDWSARVTGAIEIDAEESAARTAQVSLVAPAGALALIGWVGQAIAIDAESLAADGTLLRRARLFTGRVDVPAYDLTTGVVTLTATDLLQEGIANLPRSRLEALTPAARWSAAVFDAQADGWQAAQDRLSTVPAALERTAWGALRLTDWAAGTPAAQFAAGAIVDGSLAIDAAPRSQIRNQVVVTWTYRFPRLKRRHIAAGYSYPFSYEAMFFYGYTTLGREEVRQALDGTGWRVTGEINFTPRRAGPFILQLGVGGQMEIGFDFTPASTADLLCMGFGAQLEKRYAQTIDEVATLTVRAAASIDRLGVSAEADSASMAVEFDTATWEKDIPPPPPGSEGKYQEPQPAPPALVGRGETYVDYMDAAGATRADADAAIACLVARAQTRLRSAHRATRVGFSVPFDPDVDLPHTLRVATARCAATGKVARVVHRLDLASGAATTEVQLAISGVGAAGLPQYESPPTPPAVPAAPAPSGNLLADATTTWVGQSFNTPGAGAPDDAVGYFTNVAYDHNSPYWPHLYDPTKPKYDVRFVLQTPVIPDADRDNLTVPVARSYETSIPEDELTVSA